MIIAAPRRFLITGGAGFIGHRVVRDILAHSANAEVAIVDNLSAGMRMPAHRERLATFAVDIRDRSSLEKITEAFKPDTVIHLAAVHHIPTCERRRVYALDVNVVGTETVLEVAEASGVERIVLASSGAVYDWCDGPLTENDSLLRPTDNYSLSKRTNEMQIALWADRTGGFARVARIFNTIGHDDPNAHLVPEIVSQIPAHATTATISLGNLTPRRDYIHADDTARALLAIAYDEGAACIDTYNVCTGEDISVAGLVELLGNVMGIRIEVREAPERRRSVDRPSQLGSAAKIRASLGFAPRKSLKIALADIVSHIRSLPSEVACLEDL